MRQIDDLYFLRFQIGSFLRRFIRGNSQFKASALALIAANTLPLFGVLYLGWDTFSIVALYWIENLIIGAINVLKMITCNPDPDEVDLSRLNPTDESYGIELEGLRSRAKDKVRWANHELMLFFVPLFVLSYGLFCFMHGMMIFAIFGHDSMNGSLGGLMSNFWHVAVSEHLLWAAAALAASHLCSFFLNYLGNGEYRRTVVPMLMMQPYGNIIVLGIAVFLGALIATALGSNVGMLMILVVGKTVLDLSLHLRERERNAQTRKSEQPPILPEVIMGETGQAPATPAALGQSRPPGRSSSGR
jgi:hypothetical protein